MQHCFGTTPAFRLGVEEALLLVDPEEHAMAHRAEEVLDRHRRFLRGGGQIGGELCDGVIELTTPVCRNAADAVAHLATLRRAAVAGRDLHLVGAGLHPDAPFGHVRLRRSDHYDAIGEEAGGAVRQSANCGMHVHVGMPDPETAVAACNGMRKWAPLLLALSANSPFWHGADSHLASARTVRRHSIPRSGLPRAFDGWSDYAGCLGALVDGFGLDGHASNWWDVRPHPELGTLEVRIADSQSSLDRVEAIAALIHCLVLHEALTRDPDRPAQELLDESHFRAARRGLDARVAFAGATRHVQEVAAVALELARGYAPKLGCAASLSKVEDLLDQGNGADRQRAVHAEAGMAGLLAHLVAETAAGLSAREAPTCAATGMGMS
jgi:carboxylate-amine ligase